MELSNKNEAAREAGSNAEKLIWTNYGYATVNDEKTLTQLNKKKVINCEISKSNNYFSSSGSVRNRTICATCKNPSCSSLKGGKCPQQKLKADGLASQLDQDPKLDKKKNKRRKKKVEKEKPLKKKKNAVEESPSLRMFGEEDVEDKLDEKVVLENENPASLVEEIKLAVIEEDEKQPVESNPDQSQVKSSEGVSENAKEVDPNSQEKNENLAQPNQVNEEPIKLDKDEQNQPAPEQPQNNEVKEEVKEAAESQPVSNPEVQIEPQRPLLKIAKYIVEDDGAPNQAEVPNADQEPKLEEVKSEVVQEINEKEGEDVKQIDNQEPIQESIQEIKQEVKQEIKQESDSSKNEPETEIKEEVKAEVSEEAKENQKVESNIKEDLDQPASDPVPEEHSNVQASTESKVELSQNEEQVNPVAEVSNSSTEIKKILDPADPSSQPPPVEAVQNPSVVKEEVKETKSESEYEDVEDQDYDVFSSDNSTERKRIVKVNYSFGHGFLTKSCIRNKITVFVKTFYNKRTMQKFTVDINSKVGSLLDKIEDSEEISSYHLIKIMYPMGRIRNLSLTETFAEQHIPDGARLVLIGKKDFYWDPTKKGRDITLYNDKLTANKKNDTDHETVLANIGFDSGQHYWEITVDAFVDLEDIYVGVAKHNIGLYTRATDTGCFWGWICTGDKKFESTPCGNHLSTFGGMCKLGDIVGILLEFNNGIGSLFFYKNKMFVGRAFDNLPPGTYYPAVCMYYGEVQVTLNPSAKKP